MIGTSIKKLVRLIESYNALNGDFEFGSINGKSGSFSTKNGSNIDENGSIILKFGSIHKKPGTLN
ncbi:MAG TPA: hypothetical protein VNQ57_04465 [Ureibacillus sp.]|nr:hypothetical protein [Ureibacillus sp.]